MDQRAQHPMHRHGFTLVELLVSIALVLMIVLGVNLVFKHASDAVGTGTAISEVTRGFRSAYTTMRNDIERDTGNSLGMLPLNTTDGNRTPFLVINSEERNPAYMSPADTTGDRARIDSLFFFAQGNFKRQTGNANELVANMDPSSQAMVWYGHLYLPDNAGNFVWPTTFCGNGNTSTNPNNYYRRDWRLGRMAIGIQPRVAPNFIIRDNAGNAQRYLGKDSGSYSTTSDLAPLTISSLTTMGGATYGMALPRITDSECDLAALESLAWYRDNMVAVNAATDLNWGANHFGTNYRFRASPFAARPLTPQAAALSMPIFLNGCASFRIDFAGDMNRDGSIDLTQDGTGIQWYGMPLNYDNTGVLGDDARDVRTVQERNGLGAPPAYEHNNGGVYTWAWSQRELNMAGADGARPSLIRFTITLVDSNGRLENGVTQEFIFTVPQ